MDNTLVILYKDTYDGAEDMSILSFTNKTYDEIREYIYKKYGLNQSFYFAGSVENVKEKDFKNTMKKFMVIPEWKMQEG